MLPKYDLDKIKFATDGPTFHRAVQLYENGKVTKFQEDTFGCSAIVLGGSPYRVSVSARRYDEGACTCYLGQNDTLCKHMVAVAIRAVTGGRVLDEKEKQQTNEPTCSGKLGTLNKNELSEVKHSISAEMRHVKPYDGPSRIWFAYQDSLSEGCNRLSAIVSGLPVSPQITILLIDLLLRLDTKLSTGGVDDSDGTVGDFITSTVHVLQEYARLDPECVQEFRKLQDQETCFDWEKPLVALIKD